MSNYQPANPNRNASTAVWWWIIAAVVGIGIIWWAIAASRNGQVATNTGYTNNATTTSSDLNGQNAQTQPQTMLVLVPVPDILTSSNNYIGQSVNGMATVDEVLANDVVWVRGEGTDRVLAVIPAVDKATLYPGESVRIHGSVKSIDNLESGTMDGLTTLQRAVISDEPAYIDVTDLQPVNNGELAAQSNRQANGNAGMGSTNSGSSQMGAGSAHMNSSGGAMSGSGGAMMSQAMIPLAAILDNPQSYYGRTISGTANVIRPDTDRGFFIKTDGNQQIFAILSKTLDSPDWKTDIDAGQRIWLAGTVFDASKASGLPELRPVSDKTMRVLGQEHVFIRVTSVRILESGSSSGS